MSNRVGAESAQDVPAGDVLRYLKALFDDAPRGSFIEVRTRIGARMRRAFYPASQLADVGTAISRRARQRDVYVGVVPRARQASGRAALVPQARFLWADCDDVAAAVALDRFTPPPQLVLASGSGDNRHAYWLLETSVSLDVIEHANILIAAMLGADLHCVDAARILRPPSMNHKRNPPKPVRLLRCDTSRRYSVDDVAGFPGDADAMHAPRRVNGVRVDDDPLLAIEPARYITQLIGVDVPRHRKVRCPFHHDRTPSLHVYEDPERGWYCFGCRRGGSIYDFASALWGLPTRGAGFEEIRQRLELNFDHTDLVHDRSHDPIVSVSH